MHKQLQNVIRKLSPQPMSKGKFYGCQHKNSDLEGLQSKSRFRNLPLRDKSSIIHTQKQEEVKIISICGQHFTIMNHPPPPYELTI